MNYTLNTPQSTGMRAAFKKMFPLLRNERGSLLLALFSMLGNSAATFVGPYLIGRTIDRFVLVGDWKGVLISAGILVAIYIGAFITNYWQMMLMGMVGQRTLYALRNLIFEKLQSLPVSFFNANKAGDLISRINNDTDKLNQFFGEIVVRFVGIIVTVLGVAAFLIGINPKLGAVALMPAVLIGVIIGMLAKFIRAKSATALRATGALSAEVQESLDNFKVIVAFDRRDFFRKMFGKANASNFKSARAAGFANAIPVPLYELAGAAAQLLVLIGGIVMIRSGNFSIGLLVGFLVYVERFYSPLRQVSALWAQLQTALAAWDRISLILELMPNLVSPQITEPDSHSGTTEILSFHEVSFGYTEGQKVLSGISLSLEEGKTYALVGPTGGGKTTTASLMARLYDPVSGEIKLFGKNMKDWSNTLRAEYIGFILQDPFLFSGTVKDNIFYGNHLYGDLKSEEALSILEKEGLSELLDRFEGGLDAEVAPQSVTLSLGQKQIIAFMRAVLRKPKILILDEATANIDTLTEEILQSILLKLPKETTKVIIAHRLNTIQNADEIFFVSGGMVTNAGSFDHAVELLLHHKRTS